MPEIVVDVGNTRMKWGLCDDDASASEFVQSTAIPLEEESAWQTQVDLWEIPVGSRWTLAGTNPGYRNLLAGWLKNHGERVHIIDDYRQLPLQVSVEHPEQVGIDRLLNAIAAMKRSPRETPIAIVGAGTAVTVDLVDSDGVFRGGAIFPGFRLMAKALNDYTAKLPMIEEFEADPKVPGLNTNAAISGGISHSILGGIERILSRYTKEFGKPHVFVAGGDSELLTSLAFEKEMVGPFLTLEGIRIAAEHIKQNSHG